MERIQEDSSWSSIGLTDNDAIRQWRDWAAATIAPVDVCVFDRAHFAAQWTSHGLGQLRMLHLHAPAQRVVHCGDEGGRKRVDPSIQLIYARQGAIETRMNGRKFTLKPGEFVLLDNTRFYRMEMQTPHEVADLMMPIGWLDRHLSDPGLLLGRPISVKHGWGAPLGSLLETVMDNMKHSPLPRPMIAEQIGSLLALATGSGAPRAGSHRSYLVREVLSRIERDYADPDFHCEGLANELGISKRSLQAVLASQGTSFVQELNATRLERAAELLTDPRLFCLPIGELAFRCGFLDSSYFTRQFRKRFGITPSRWRKNRAS
ncbi:helix-turn-helix domain-containing protein [Altericroceibacterium spongiae]|uniref:Helix-turn-helix domain-containing protein n=1 Tax=Altericroceibacterium spongiae TaxID=2320269 RepID=A0A420ECF8_9SPHN|nr:helix-turn-helix domain-containing protein [Altericroceibacterium spongiae]RKF18343.1 helix-turn-helix domain-containing protein [Altericroceibacterium spongiae]